MLEFTGVAGEGAAVKPPECCVVAEVGVEASRLCPELLVVRVVFIGVGRDARRSAIQ